MAKKIIIQAELDDSKLQKQLDDIGKRKEKITVDVDSGNIGNADQNMKHLNRTVADSNSVFGRLKKTIGNTFSSGKLAMTGYLMVLNEINKAGKNAKQTIQEIDKAVTDLSVATNMSRESVTGLIKDYNAYAKQLSSTTTQITSAADDYLRAGKSMSETQALIKDSIMLSKLGKLESGAATEDLLAVMNGYEMSIEEVGKALDAMVAIDMKAATSAGDIATALKYCASSADVAGLSFDKLAAMIATTQEKTMQSAETIGTFMNTILSRYRNVKIGQFVDDSGEDLSEVETILDSLNIKLRNSEQEFRDFEKVVEEVAQSWDSYSSVQQAAIAKAFSGTRQQNRFLALMEGYAKTLELTEVAANSAGTAVEKFNNSYMESLEAKQNTLQASFESMIMNTDFSEVYGGILDATTALVDFINQTNALKVALAGLTVAGGIKAFLTIKTGVTEAYIALNKFQNALDITKKVSISTSEYEKLLLLSNGLSTSQMKLVLSTNSLTLAQKQELLMASGLSAEEAALQLETWGMTAANTGLTASTVTLGNAFKALWATMIANPLVMITTLISGAVMAYQAYKQHVVEAAEATKEAIETFESISSEVESLEGKLSDLNEQIGKLDPITDAEDIENLQLETEELEKQLAILKEKQRIAESDADKAAQKSLGMTEASRYKTEERESAYGGVESGAAYVTKDEELQNAIEAYEKYKAKVDEANDALVHMAETGDYTQKEWDEQEKVVSTYSEKMDDARSHANELATSLDEQKQGLSGNTDASQVLLTKIDGVITLYDQWLKKINGTTEALEGQAEAEKDVSGGSSNTFDSKLIASQESLDKFKSSVQSATEAYTTLLSGNYSSSELLNSIQAISQAVSDMGGSLNWEFINSQTNSLDLLGDAIQHISQKYAESILSGAGIDINSEFGQMLANLVTQAFEAQAAFEGMNSQLDDLQASYQTLTEVLESYNKTGYISLDSLQSLLTADENLIAMLEVENGQLAINQEAYENLVIAQLMEFKAKLNDAAAAEIEALAKQKAEQATNQNADASNNAVEKLDAETAAFNRNTSAALSNAITKAEESGVSESEIQGILDKYNEVWNAAVNNFSGNFDGFMGGAASKAGKKAGDAYVDAFEKELKKLQTLRDQGKITEKQYLDYLRKLYQRFFRDKKKYAEQYAKYEHEYLQGMKSLYESALSGITSMLDKQVSAYGDARDAAVESLEAQRDAAIEALEAEKERYEQEIELINKQIAAKQKAIQKVQDEIDAMRSANAEKKQALNLQQDEYNLQRMLNQRSKQVYKDGQIVFDTDTSGLGEAKQKVEDDKLEIEISKKEKEIKLIEKEIDLLNEKKDGINENIDLLDKQIDQINEYYDKLISDTEKYWNNLISGIQDYKSRWEELAEIEENAKLISTLKQLGIKVDDVLGMSEEAFSKFKDEYIGILADIYSGNDSMLSALSDTTGRSVDQMGSYLDSTQGYIDSLSGMGDSLDPLAESIGNVEESMGTLASMASEANDNLSNAAGSVDNVNSSLSETASTTSTVATNVGTVVDGLNQLPDSSKVSGLSNEFETLAKKIGEVAKALGISEGQAVGTLFQAMSNLNSVTLGNEGEGIISQFTLLKQAILDVIETIGSSEEQTVGSLMSAIAQLNSISLDESIITQFNNLETAINQVTAAISGGGGESSEGEGSGSGSGSTGGQSGGKGSQGKGESGGSNSLTGAINEMGETAKEVIGEPDAEGDGTVIGEFGSMETAVNDVRDAIGTEGSEGGSGGNSGGEGDDTLVGSIEYLGDKTEEEMGESGGDGIIGRFEEFESIIEEAANQVKSISEGLDEIDGKEVECTITINVKMNGSIPAFASGTVLGNMQIESATYNAKYGKAFASGTIGLPKAEKNALVSEYGQTEMTVLPDGKTIITDTPTMMDLPKDTVIYNEEETKKIMDNKVDVSGNAHADGTDDSIWTTLADGTKVRDLQPGDRMYDMVQKFDAYFNSMDGNIEKLVPNSVYEHQRQMEDMAKQINYVSSVVNNNRNVQQPVINGGINITCPGVTSKEVAQQVGVELNNMFSGLHLEAMQQSMMR